MTTRSVYGYTRKVVNRAGGILVLPNVGDYDGLLTTPDADPFAQSATQKFPLGTKLVEGDRAWRYVLNGGAALVPGFTTQSPAGVSGHLMDMVTAAAAVGDLTVTVTPVSASVTKNQYKDGYLFTNDLAGEGQCFKIKSHPAITHTNTGVITLYDPVTLALTSSCLTGLRACPFNGVIITPHTTLTGMILGVSQIPVTLAQYAWIQSRGPVAVHTIGTLVLGEQAVGDTTSGSVAGAVGPATAGMAVVGTVMNASVTLDKSLVFLTLD